MQEQYNPTPADVQRFWSKVAKRGPDECWEWTAGRHEFGYGRIKWGDGPQTAHRIVWELTYGPVPDGMHVLHKCDNPPCCNPAHLWLGTHRDNMLDRDKKGHAGGPPGERSGNCKLTDEQVAEIRRLFAAGQASTIALARDFGVTRTYIYDLLNYKWRKLPTSLSPR